jgi:hypothetical protein
MIWQPVATAPKDGTEILLCQAIGANGPIVGDTFGIFIQVAAWWAAENTGEGDWIVYCSLPLDPSLHFIPTHWMPLPAPPADAAEVKL